MHGDEYQECAEDLAALGTENEKLRAEIKALNEDAELLTEHALEQTKEIERLEASIELHDQPSAIYEITRMLEDIEKLKDLADVAAVLICAPCDSVADFSETSGSCDVCDKRGFCVKVKAAGPLKRTPEPDTLTPHVASYQQLRAVVDAILHCTVRPEPLYDEMGVQLGWVAQFPWERWEVVLDKLSDAGLIAKERTNAARSKEEDHGSTGSEDPPGKA